VHHAYVDKQWFRWQNVCPAFKTYYGGARDNSGGGRAQVTDQITGLPFFVTDSLDTTGGPLCYVYEAAPADTTIPTPTGGCPAAPITAPTVTATLSTVSVAPLPTGDSQLWFQDMLNSLIPSINVQLGGTRRLKIGRRDDVIAGNETVSEEPLPVEDKEPTKTVDLSATEEASSTETVTATATSNSTATIDSNSNSTATITESAPAPSPTEIDQTKIPGYGVCSQGNVTVNVLRGDNVTVPTGYKAMLFRDWKILAIPCKYKSISEAHKGYAMKLWLVSDEGMDVDAVPEYHTPEGLKAPEPDNPDFLQYPTCIEPDSNWAAMMGLVPKLLKETCNKMKEIVDECNNNEECRKKFVVDVREKVKALEAAKQDGEVIVDEDSKIVVSNNGTTVTGVDEVKGVKLEDLGSKAEVEAESASRKK
jgi:hypothetical protein